MKKGQDIFIFLGTIIALLGLMVLKQFVTPASTIAEQIGSGGFDPNAIAATGFIILAAFTMGELFKQLKMPALLGYIAAGIIFGPDLSKIIFDTTDRAIFSGDVIDRLALINTLTVGVIGTLGGGELKISELKDQAGTILWVIGMSFLAIVPVSGAVVFGLSYVLPDIVPFLAEVPPNTKLAVSMLFGVFGFAMSPAATLAIIQETRAKGRFTSLTLGVVIVADLVLVASFLLTFNFAKLLTRPEGFSTQALLESLPAIGAEFGWAIVIGVVMGLVFIAYLRFVAREKLLFTVGVIFSGAAIAKMLHAEMLLAFLVAGFIVQNLSRHGHDMIHALEKISLPVFVVYFMIQAAQLDLVSLLQFMPLALILTAVRTAGLYGGVKLATRVVKAPEHIDSNLWMAFFSRGGVDIVLATLVANQIDTWGQDFKAVIMATVVIHIIGGPAILKWVFERVGETAEARKQGSEEVAELDRMLHGDHSSTEDPFARPEFGNDQVNERLDDIVALLEGCYERCIVEQLDQRHEYLEQAVERISVLREKAIDDLLELLEDADTEPDSLARQVKRIHVRFRQALQPQVEILEALEPMAITSETTDDLLGAVRSFVDFDEHYRVEWEPRLLEASEDDGQLLRAVKVIRRVREKVAGLGTRSVSLGRLWRYYMELSLPGYLASAVSATADRNETFWYEFGAHLRRVDELFEATVRILREETREPTEPTEDTDASTEELVAANGQMSPKVSALPMSLSPGASAEDESHDEGHGHADDHHAHDAEPADATTNEDDTAADDGADQSAELQAESDATSPLEDAREWVESASSDLEEGGETLNRLLVQFVQTSRDRFTFAVQRAYADFIEGVQLAGTVELPSFRYRPSGRYDDAQRAEQRLHHRLSRESNIVAGYQGWISLDQQLVLFLHWFRSYQRRVTNVLDERFQQGALQTLQRFLSRCRERPSALDNSSAGDDAAEHVDWSTWYHEQLQPALDAARSSLDKALTGFSQGIVTRRLMDVLEARVARFSESTRLLVQNPVESVDGGADVETVDLPLRAWYFSKLVREAALSLVEFNERAERIVRRALVGLGDVEHVLEEQLVSEQSEDEASDDDVANQLAMRGLEDAQKQLDNILEKVRSDERELRVWVIAESTQIVQDSTAPFLEHRLMEVMRDLSRARGETLAQRSVEPIISRLKGAYRTVAPLYEELASDLQQRLSQETKAPSRNDLRERLMERQRDDTARTPAIYRRLFSPVPVDIPDFYVERPALEQRCLEAVDYWFEEQPTSLLISGDRGMGKRTLVHHVLPSRIFSKYFDLNEEQLQTVRIDEQVETERDLCANFSALVEERSSRTLSYLTRQLQNTARRQIVFVENGDKLFTRTREGLALCERFLKMMGDTADRVLWIVLMSDPARTLLQTAIGIDDYFTHTLSLQPLTGEQIERTIMSRHEVSGFDIEFSRPRLAVLDRIRHPIESSDALRNPRDEYFERLANLTNGNPLLALLYWLETTRVSDSEDDCIVVEPLPEREMNLVESLSLDKKLILATLVQHSALSVSQLSRVLRTGLTTVKTEIDHLQRLGFVEHITSTANYRLRDFPSVLVAQALREMNLV